MYLQFEALNTVNQQFFDPGIRVASGTQYPTMHPLEKRNIWLTIEILPRLVHNTLL
jgi:hypothetical protein